MMRLQRFLAECGLASRRGAEAIIEAGRVTVNGVVAALGASIDPARDNVSVDGVAIKHERKVYLVLNKPRGVITSAKDTHGRRTVLECIEGVSERVFPVGRLDLDVEGALLLTNDGELAHRLMHPKFEVEKVYRATVEGEVTIEVAGKLAKGVELEDGAAAPVKVRIINARPDRSLIRLVLHEGRKHEVKRMCAAVGHPVIELERVSVGGVHVRDLRSGEWRYLAHHEIAELRKLAGL